MSFDPDHTYEHAIEKEKKKIWDNLSKTPQQIELEQIEQKIIKLMKRAEAKNKK